MDHIIAAVDLSKNSKDAVRYAARLAEKTGADLLILHCQSLLDKAVSHSAGQADTQKDPQKWIQKRLDKLKIKIPHLAVDAAIRKENLLDYLLQLSNHGKAGIVVAGIRGNGENESIPGLMTDSLIKNLRMPLLLIPEGYKFKGIDKIIIASNSTSYESSTSLNPILKLQQAFKPHVQLLHISSQQETFPEQDLTLTKLANDMIRYESGDLNESIRDYLALRHADLLCITSKDDSWLNEIASSAKFPSSVFKMEIPVLLLKAEEN